MPDAQTRGGSLCIEVNVAIEIVEKIDISSIDEALPVPDVIGGAHGDAGYGPLISAIGIKPPS